jgi:integrase
MTSSVEHYLTAAERPNTRRSYESAVRHFEVEWGGFLPATADAISRYLADYGGQLAFNTLKQRLAALAQWHQEQGFPDPTKAPVVRKVLKGIRTLHPAVEKQALPLQISQIEQIVNCLDNLILQTRQSQNHATELRHTRDKALLLIGFWRGFRGDELKRLQIEYIQLTPGQGLQCFLPQSKSDRQLQGRTFRVPALARLCPVAAYEEWLAISGLTNGPVFRGIDRWGSISAGGLHENSLIPLLRRLFTRAGLSMADEFSSHSLRRGFAGWATANGWDLKTLMEYVGWKDVKSAMRYIDGVDPFSQYGIETRRLSASRPSSQQE